MRCPNCSSKMVHQQWSEKEGFVCTSCTTVWMTDSADWQAIAIPKDVRAGNKFRRAIGLKCPKCSQKLQSVKAGGAYRRVTAQLCLQCTGILLNEVDFRLLWKKKKKIERLRVKRPDEMTNDEYYRKYRNDSDMDIQDCLFNFFTGMPIEINVPPQKPAIVTYCLIALNVLIFLITGTDSEVYKSFGLTPVDATSKIYTFITAMFLHGGWIHLLGNMYFLYIFGDNVEDRLGKVNYLLFYLLCGVIAGAAYVLFQLQSSPIAGISPGQIPVVGASGAIGGIMGAYLLACPKVKMGILIIFYPIRMPAFFYLFIWVALQVLISMTSSNIAWQAHLGGFFCGIVAYYALKKLVPKWVEQM